MNALVGLLWRLHTHHRKASAWFERERPEVPGCALTELSFIRVSMADRNIAATFEEADELVSEFIRTLAGWYRLSGQLPGAAVLKGSGAAGHKQVGDVYLCKLAKSHGARLATLDSGLKHPSAHYIG